MEKNEFHEKLINLDLSSKYGSDLIYLNMPLAELNSILWDYFCVFGDQKNDGFCMFYNIKILNSIRIRVEILKQKVYGISFYGDYKGTYNGIGIGSTIRELLEVRDDVYFDEQFILVGKFPWDFILKIDNNDSTIYNLDDVLDNKIIEITVEDKLLLK